MKPICLTALYQPVKIIRRGSLTTRWEVKAIMHGMPFSRELLDAVQQGFTLCRVSLVGLLLE